MGLGANKSKYGWPFLPSWGSWAPLGSLFWPLRPPWGAFFGPLCPLGEPFLVPKGRPYKGESYGVDYPL